LFSNIIKNISNSQNPSIGDNFFEIEKIASTNSYAIELIQANLASHGDTFFAHEQTSGKGQMGKKWITEPSSNIIMSCVVATTRFGIQYQFGFNLLVALACYDFFSFYAGSSTSIKWPNDIYWNDRKAGGILIENIIRGKDWKWAVIGIGININQTKFSDDLINPVSLKQILNKEFNPIDLSKHLCKCLQKRLLDVVVADFKATLDEYNNILYKKNQLVNLKFLNNNYFCEIINVNELGELVVKIDSESKVLKFGDVEWIL
jgi:BirA family biotin operon repressor/biotin-[acetyl-CoA-carboxylase] ligase